MNVPHNINNPFETIIYQIKTVIKYSNTGKVPYTPEQVVTTAYDLIFVTGYFTNDCRWKQNPVVEKIGRRSRITSRRNTERGRICIPHPCGWSTQQPMPLWK